MHRLISCIVSFRGRCLMLPLSQSYWANCQNLMTTTISSGFMCCKTIRAPTVFWLTCKRKSTICHPPWLGYKILPTALKKMRRLYFYIIHMPKTASYPLAYRAWFLPFCNIQNWKCAWYPSPSYGDARQKKKTRYLSYWRPITGKTPVSPSSYLISASWDATPLCNSIHRKTCVRLLMTA